MKLLKFFLRCPLLFLLLAGWGGLTVYTCAEGNLADAMENNIISNPVFTALLKRDTDIKGVDLEQWGDMREPEIPSGSAISGGGNSGTGKKNDTGTDNQKADGYAGNGKGENTGGKKNGNGGAGNQSSQKPSAGGNGKKDKDSREETGITRYETYEKQETDSPYYLDPGMRALTTDYPYQKVDKSYFDDAVFIGDSRTEGMHDYSGLDNATFFARTGLSVYELLEDEFITDPATGSQVSVSHMLKHNKYGKIYFMIGINELGTGNTGTFLNAYARVISRFRKWQPDAVIYIQGIIPVSKSKSDSDPVYNNVNINDKNVAVSRLADGKNIFYFDVSKSLTDKAGNMKDEYTFDDIHMYAQHYQRWTDFLMEHGVVRKGKSAGK